MRIQLVLGAGGVRCFAYIGAIQELEERGYTFSSVSGVSAGAMLSRSLPAQCPQRSSHLRPVTDTAGNRGGGVPVLIMPGE